MGIRVLHGASLVLSLIIVFSLALHFTYSPPVFLKTDNDVRREIARLKNEIRKSEMMLPVTLLIPPGTRNVMEQCLSAAYRSPIKLSYASSGYTGGDMCTMETGPIGYVRVRCPKTAEILAERCAKKILIVR